MTQICTSIEQSKKLLELGMAVSNKAQKGEII